MTKGFSLNGDKVDTILVITGVEKQVNSHQSSKLIKIRILLVPQILKILNFNRNVQIPNACELFTLVGG
jgi:hypothetical protein